MREDAFVAWLSHRWQPEAVKSCVSRIRRVEDHYGDLDAIFDENGLTALIDSFAYGAAAKAACRPNPTRIDIDGDIRNGLASLKGAVRAYRDFRLGHARAAEAITAGF